MKWFAFVLLILLITACAKKGSGILPDTAPVSTPVAPPVNKGDSVTYLALGDSYTFGVGAAQNQSFPDVLTTQLTGAGYRAAAPVVIAQTGWTAADLLAGITASAVTNKFDIVTLMIGVNDQNTGTSTETYATELDQLISQAIVYAKGYKTRVFVISIPDWSVTPYAANMNQTQIAADIALFNSIIKAQSGKFGVNYVDITTISEMAADDPTLTSSDGFHPSAKMYALWANQLYAGVVGSFN